MPLFETDTITSRWQRATAALGPVAPLVLVAAGNPIPKPGGLDQTYPFLAHPEYYWLTGSRRSGGVLAYEPSVGWTHFVRPVDAAERLWEGEPDAVEGIDVAEFDDWLKARSNRPIALLGSPIPNVAGDDTLSAAMRERLDTARRVKDHAEIALVERAVRATAAGFARAREAIRPGVTERAIQIEIEAEFFRHGADGVGYGTIVGAGRRAAILHSTPGQTVVGRDDVVLVDAGSEIAGYTADVTRTFAASGRFTPDQQAIYDVVLAAELAAIAACREGVEWHDVHSTAASELAAGLRHLGILKVTANEALDTEAIALFFPHGIGHMVGLGVRDVGGRAPGREEGRKCCGAKVRVDLPLCPNFLMTVEPGLYFVPALLDDPERREQFKNAVAWDALDRWRKVGGVRIEDDVLVTAGEPQVLTASIAK
ncbi:MAG: aminopeptidase P family protein [Pirellulales bacterium]